MRQLSLLCLSLFAWSCSTGDTAYVPKDLALPDGTLDRGLLDQKSEQRPQDLQPAAEQAADGRLLDSLPQDTLQPDLQPRDLTPGPDATLCGNGRLDSPLETCDKALPQSDEDACPQSCDDSNSCTSDSLLGSVAACTASCAHTPIPNCCGNGIKEAGEQCDDGNKLQGDGCDNSCQLPGGHLLLTEVAVSPSDAEFVEIYNPAATTQPLDSVYLSDRSDYFTVPQGSISTGLGNDFTVRFPDGATIAPGQYVVIALGGSLGFKTAYGLAPDYELKSTEQTVPDMVAAVPSSVGSKAGLTDDGELVILFSWDKAADLIQDLDYVVWKGSNAEAVYKSSQICIDGPDADSDSSCFLDDTPVVSQSWLPPSASGGSLHRCNYLEGNESQSGGNGVSGHDETSEPFDLAGATWKRNNSSLARRTPGATAPLGFCAQ